MAWTGAERAAVAERFADRRIFVSVVGVRDPELAATVRRAVVAAAQPARLRFGICHVFDDATANLLEDWSEDPRVAIDRVPSEEHRGVAWARARANQLFDAEPYVLQLDARRGFVHGWDQRLIELLATTQRARPVISVDATPSGPSAAGTVGLVPTPRLRASSLFAPGGFLVDVPADPATDAQDEDLVTSVRAYTWGYDLFRAIDPVVYRWPAAAAPLPEDGDDLADGTALAGLLQRLLRPRRAAGSFGLGHIRTTAAYEQFAAHCRRTPPERARSGRT